MKFFVSTLAAMSVSLSLWPVAALAQGHRRPPVNVPEIDAATGLLALAAVLALLALAHDRRRRARGRCSQPGNSAFPARQASRKRTG